VITVMFVTGITALTVAACHSIAAAVSWLKKYFRLLVERCSVMQPENGTPTMNIRLLDSEAPVPVWHDWQGTLPLADSGTGSAS
jgi:hypothetical protein